MRFLKSLIRAGVNTAINAQQQARREQLRVAEFNDKWNRLVHFHNLVIKNFCTPLEPYFERMTEKEVMKLLEYIEDMDDWYDQINDLIDYATKGDLARYGTSIKKAALKSMNLCKKYSVYSDMHVIEYVADEKTIYLNGNRYYILK